MKHMRYNNILRPLTSKIQKYKIASYDIETETQTGMNGFLQGGFIDERGIYKSFTDKDKMIEYMLKHTSADTKIYATNNKFDYSALFGHTKEFLKENPMLRGGILMHSEYRHLKFYDTLSYCKASVEEIGKLLGKPKIKYNLTKNRYDMTKRQWRTLIEYNKRDCEITREFMIGFQKVINDIGGELKTTIGSCAMDIYRRKYLKQPIHHEYCRDYHFYDMETVREFIFRAMHGGRTEMFKRGQDTENIYYKGDFNSLYPSVMQTEYPLPESAEYMQHSKGLLQQSTIEKYEGISECEVISPYMYYPILPTYIKDKLCFPIGRFRDVFTHIELREFLRHGGKILKIYKTVYYKSKFKPFDKWVQDLYALRLRYSEDGNIVYKQITKLLLNNLFGKFGQHRLNDTVFYHIDERNDDDISQDGIIFDEESGFGYRETPKDSNQVFVIPIFSTYTTAKGRNKLYHALRKYESIYCDTDSVFTRQKIITSDKLGELKCEGIFSGLNIAKQKHYKEIGVDGEVGYKIKGLRMTKYDEDDVKGSKEQREKEFEDSISGHKIPQMRILGIKEAIRGHKKINQQIYVTKKFNLSDTKRVWIKPYSRDGMKDSEPIIIGYENLSQLSDAYEQS